MKAHPVTEKRTPHTVATQRWRQRTRRRLRQLVGERGPRGAATLLGVSFAELMSVIGRHLRPSNASIEKMAARLFSLAKVQT